jgi:hypothetical protein
MTTLTKHGVRNLNGPHMNGTGHNGKSPSCPHWKAPDLPVYRAEGPRGTECRCTMCGESRWLEKDRPMPVAPETSP